MSKTIQTVISLTLLVSLKACVPVSSSTSQSSDKKLNYQDKDFEDYVGNVILNSNNPFARLGNAQPLMLEFDLLTENFENLQARYIHCNADWTPSPLQDLQFLDAFNRFDHKSFDYSVNTKTPYVRYLFELPRPNRSGNYIVALYRRDNPPVFLAGTPELLF